MWSLVMNHVLFVVLGQLELRATSTLHVAARCGSIEEELNNISTIMRCLFTAVPPHSLHQQKQYGGGGGYAIAMYEN